MASTVFNGTNLLIKIADDAGSPATIGHTTSCSISFTNDMADATTKDSAGFSESIAGLRSAEVSFDGLVDYTDANGGKGLRVFKYANKNVYLAEVNKQPNVEEITHKFKEELTTYGKRIKA